jgi:branched-chain amino acid transport system substrate-binding protein
MASPRGGKATAAWLAGFQRRLPDPGDDYRHARTQAVVELLVQAIEQAGNTEPVVVALALEGLKLGTTRWRPQAGFHDRQMRAADHQFQQALYVSVMGRAGTSGIDHEVEGSGFGFRTVRRFDARQVERAAECRMIRSD